MPDISVIIPMYNTEAELQQCLDSTCGQTLENLEILCVDDGSTDNTPNIALEAARLDPRIKVFLNANNQGSSAVRNIGINNASGTFIYFMDSDDFFPTDDALASLFECAVHYSSEETIGRTIQWLPEENILTDAYHVTYQKKNIFDFTILQHDEFIDNCISCNKLIKKEFILKNNILFDNDLKKFEDNPFAYKIHLAATSISYLHKHTYTHRKRRNPENPSKSYSPNIDDALHRYKAFLYSTHFALRYRKEKSQIITKRAQISMHDTLVDLKNAKSSPDMYKKLRLCWDKYIELIATSDPQSAKRCEGLLSNWPAKNEDNQYA